MPFYTIYLNSDNTTGQTPYNNAVIISKPSTSSITYLVDFDQVFKKDRPQKYKLRSQFTSLPIANTSTTGITGLLTMSRVSIKNSNISTVVLGELTPTNNIDAVTSQYLLLGSLTGTVASGGTNRPSLLTATSSTGLSATSYGAGDYIYSSATGLYYLIVYLATGQILFPYVQGLPINAVSTEYLVYRRVLTSSQATTPSRYYTYDNLDSANPDELPSMYGKQYITINATNYTQNSSISIGEYSLKLVFEAEH
jgi:hypothetical protein